MAVFAACWPGLHTSPLRTEPQVAPLPPCRLFASLWGPATLTHPLPASPSPSGLFRSHQWAPGSERGSGALWAPSPARSRFAATARPPSHASLSSACAHGLGHRAVGSHILPLDGSSACLPAFLPVCLGRSGLHERVPTAGSADALIPACLLQRRHFPLAAVPKRPSCRAARGPGRQQGCAVAPPGPPGIEGGALRALLGVSACGCVLAASASVLTLSTPPPRGRWCSR